MSTTTSEVAQALCPACGSATAGSFFELRDVPTNSCIVLDTLDEALAYPRGNLQLVRCTACEFIFNRCFDATLTEYSARYEETQGCSPTFRAFHETLARGLIERHALHARRVVEIGCGKGEFLHLLAALGGCHGIGFDPSFHPGRIPAPDCGSVEVIPALFPHNPLPPDCALVCCKMTLEHIARPHEFLTTLHREMRNLPDTAVFFMVPNAERILREAAFEDLYFEHCNYFTRHALMGLFERCGFRVEQIEAVFGNQYLCVHARIGDADSSYPAAPLPESVFSHFRKTLDTLRADWQERFRGWQSGGSKVVLWGAGSKSLAFVSLLGVERQIAALVDINPHRQASWQPGTGLPIVAPESLRALRPDVVIAMNPMYLGEIAEALASVAPTAKLHS